LFIENYTDLERIAENMTNNVPKVYLKRIDLSNITLSSVENSSEGN